MLSEVISVAFRATEARLSPAVPLRDRIDRPGHGDRIGFHEPSRDHGDPSQEPAGQPNPPPPCRPGHFPGSTTLGAGSRIVRPTNDGHAHWSRPAKPGHDLLRHDRNRTVVGQHDVLYPDALTVLYLLRRFPQLLPPFGGHVGRQALFDIG